MKTIILVIQMILIFISAFCFALGNLQTAIYFMLGYIASELTLNEIN